MSDEEDEKVEVVVAGHGGLRVDPLTGQRKGGAPLNSERLAKMPLQSGQSTITAAFKKQKTGAATKAAAESTHSGALSSLAPLPCSRLMGSSGSTSKRQRGIDGDGVGGYYHEVLLPPSMPNIHEIDFEALMREWESEGHKLGTFKGVDGDSAESSSKVIKRMLAEKSPTFLFKGPSEN